MAFAPWKIVEDAAEAVWDVLDEIPGVGLLGDGIQAAWEGPLRDFARTGVGQTVLRAMSTGAMAFAGGLTLGMGPYQVFAMASAAALPGLARGDAFEEALLVENLWRIEETIKTGGGEVLAASLPPQWAAGLEEIKARAAAAFSDLPIPDAARELARQAGLDPEEYARRLAAEMGIREDMAVQAMEMAARLNLIDQAAYDIPTGAKIGAPSARGAAALAAFVGRQTVTNRSAALDFLRPPSSGPSFLERATAPGLQTEVSWLRLARAGAATPAALERTAAPLYTPDPGPGVGGVALLMVAAAGVAWFLSRRPA